MPGPDITRLVRRPRIEKPTEQFLLENPPPSAPLPPPPPPVTPPAGSLGTLPAAPPARLSQQLLNEAAHVQNLLDTLTAAAAPLVVAVPQEHQATLGPTITTDQYLTAAGGRDAASLSARNLFEKNLLSGCGSNPHWPTVLAPDLIDLKGALLTAVTSMETALPVPVTHGSGLPDLAAAWPVWSEASPLSDTHSELLAQSQAYRMKVGQTLQTLSSSLDAGLVRLLLNNSLVGELTRLKGQLPPTLALLRRLRALLCHSQLLLAFEQFHVRQVLSQLFVEALESQLLNGLLVLLSRLQTSLIAPTLTAFEQQGLVGAAIAQPLTAVVGSTLATMKQQYLDVAADLIRDQRKKSELRLQRLQVLGERATVGRWLEQFDQIIAELTRLQNTATVTEELRGAILARVTTPPPPPASPWLQAFQQDPTLIADPTPFAMRQTLFTGGDPGLFPAPFFEDGTSEDPDAAAGDAPELSDRSFADA